jgi:hypothetical protein
LPHACLAGRLADRPLAHRHDQAGLFGQRDEVARRHQHAVARQRISASTPTIGAAHVDLGLVVQHQFVAFDRLVQRAFEFELLAALAGQRGRYSERRIAALPP